MKEQSGGVIFFGIVFGAVASFVTLRRTWPYFSRGVYAPTSMEEAILMWLAKREDKLAAHQRQSQPQDPKHIRFLVFWNTIWAAVMLLLTIIAAVLWIATTLF